MTTHSSHATHAPAEQAGFTIVEVMVAALVLLVGLLGVVTMLDVAMLTTNQTNARVGATNLERELLETARGLPYEKLAPASLTSSMQARVLPVTTGAPWTVVRRGVTYTVTATACTVDSPDNGLASPPPASVCLPQAPSTVATVDPNGDDFRRVTFQVAWTDRGSTRSLTQTATVVNPSGGLGPPITNIAPPTQTITDPTVSLATVTFTSALAATMLWHADDGKSQGSATAVTPAVTPQTWTVAWPLGASGSALPVEVLDGTYQLTAQASDTRGIAGASKSATVQIARRKPYAPPSLAGGHDTLFNNVVDLSWRLNAERDVVGYRVYWVGPSGNVQICPSVTGAILSSTTSSCTDLGPSAPGATNYYVVALDRDTPGTLQEGDPTPLPISPAMTISAATAQPPAPTALTRTTVNGLPTLSWTPSGTPSFYRIYRNGTAIGSRYDVAAGAATTWSDSVAGATSYTITAVDATYNESPMTGPV